MRIELDRSQFLPGNHKELTIWYTYYCHDIKSSVVNSPFKGLGCSGRALKGEYDLKLHYSFKIKLSKTLGKKTYLLR